MAQTLKFGNGTWATKKGSTLAYNDEGGNFKPLPFTYTGFGKGTRVNKEGLIEVVENEPRIDYKDDSKGALLLEPSRTNLVTHSEKLSNWTQYGVSTVDNSIISPDGTQNASKITFNDGIERIVLDVSTTSAVFTGYFKGIQGQRIIFRDNSGTVVNDITLTDTWTRYEFIKTTSNSNIQIQNNDADYVYAWGIQAEEGSYATSYIPTSGSAVTRVAESTSQTVPDGVIGQTEGTVFLDFKPQTLDGTSRYLSIENSSSVGSGWMGVFASLVSGAIRFRFYGDGWDIDSSLMIEKGTRYKIAFSYKNGVQTSIYINGNLLDNITASLSGKSYQKIRLSEGAIGNRGDADFNDIKLYDTIKTDQELIALTTI